MLQQGIRLASSGRSKPQWRNIHSPRIVIMSPRRLKFGLAEQLSMEDLLLVPGLSLSARQCGSMADSLHLILRPRCRTRIEPTMRLIQAEIDGQYNNGSRPIIGGTVVTPGYYSLCIELEDECCKADHGDSSSQPRTVHEVCLSSNYIAQ